MPNARLDQSVRESVQTGNPKARLDQVVRESVQTGNPKARLVQVIREAIILPQPPASKLMAFDDDANQQRAMGGYYLVGSETEERSLTSQQVYEIVFSST